jgi:hypothetical protein
MSFAEQRIRTAPRSVIAGPFEPIERHKCSVHVKRVGDRLQVSIFLRGQTVIAVGIEGIVGIVGIRAMIGNAEKVEAGSIPRIQVSIIREAARVGSGAATVRILRVAMQLPIIDIVYLPGQMVDDETSSQLWVGTDSRG